MQEPVAVFRPAGSPEAAPTRYHALDALRAFALILGIVFHSALSFIPGNFEWATHDVRTSHLLGYFVVLSHSFRLEIFFLMAGFFGHLVFHRRGFKTFAIDRVKRILAPFLVGWFVITPMLAFVWLLGDGVPPGQALVLSTFDLIRRVTGIRPGFLTGTHLWFLYYLLLLYAGSLCLRAVFIRLADPSGSRRVWIDGKLDKLFRCRLAVLVPALVSTVFLWGMKEWGVDTPQTSLVPDIPTTLLYGFIFCLGWILHRQPDLLGVLSRRWPAHLALGLILSLGTAAMLLEVTHGRTDHRPAFVLLYALMMWLMVFGVTGLFLRYFADPSPAWRYVADSSYWLYIAHLPLVALLQVRLAAYDLPWVLKIVAINLISFPVLLLSYHYLVRSTFIGATLNGKKHP